MLIKKLDAMNPLNYPESEYATFLRIAIPDIYNL